MRRFVDGVCFSKATTNSDPSFIPISKPKLQLPLKVRLPKAYPLSPFQTSPAEHDNALRCAFETDIGLVVHLRRYSDRPVLAFIFGQILPRGMVGRRSNRGVARQLHFDWTHRVQGAANR